MLAEMKLDEFPKATRVVVMNSFSISECLHYWTTERQINECIWMSTSCILSVLCDFICVYTCSPELPPLHVMMPSLLRAPHFADSLQTESAESSLCSQFCLLHSPHWHTNTHTENVRAERWLLDEKVVMSWCGQQRAVTLWVSFKESFKIHEALLAQ